jgi:hypothetical protein
LLCARYSCYHQCCHQGNDRKDHEQFNARKRFRILASPPFHNMIAQAPSITGAIAAQAQKWPIPQSSAGISVVAVE